MARQSKARSKKEEYDWLNDPFDEKKSQAESESAGLSTGSKIALGCGCCLIVLIVVAVLAIGGFQFFALLAS